MPKTLTTQARVPTPLASRYLQQLCKHFEHRLDVRFTPAEGRIAFDGGTCTLAAEPDCLVLTVAAADAAALARVGDVVARHLVRFAFREPPEIVWSPSGTAGAGL